VEFALGHRQFLVKIPGRGRYFHWYIQARFRTGSDQLAIVLCVYISIALVFLHYCYSSCEVRQCYFVGVVAAGD